MVEWKGVIKGVIASIKISKLNLNCVKKESIRKLSNFNVHWTKTLYQNNLYNISFFFTFFKGYRYN